MSRLCHGNIIQFIDVFETSDQLLMVMEYFPGDELFDVILAKKFLTEQDARPIFAQICNALFYLHSLNIIHRDIKPENVLISRQPDPITGLSIAKLVDFGLSKNAGAGSAAKTFVGTPCYLAPEVELTSKGDCCIPTNKRIS
jgi:serine/threonine protein kinase